MKFFVAIILTAILGFAVALYFPWWSFAVTSAIVALAVHQRAWKSFVTGFAGLFILWGGMAFFIDAQNNHVLSQKVGAVLMLGNSSIALILVTALIGALISGFAALTGSYARNLKRKPAAEA